MQDAEGTNDGPTLATNRVMDVVVALLLLAACAVVIFDSTRLGFSWREGEGPAPGYFPFYIAIILGIASLVNLFSALLGSGSGVIDRKGVSRVRDRTGRARDLGTARG